MADATSTRAPGAADLMDRRRALLGPAYRLFYEQPLHIVRGEGAYLYDAEGRRYLDAYNNVAAVGHAHPHVADAIARQARVLNTHTRYLHAGILDYAERLLGHMPGGLGNAMFTCTGSEANDLALRVARHHTQAQGVIVTRFAYHGVTTALVELSPSLGASAVQGPHTWRIAAPDSYRTAPQRLGESFAEGVQEAIDALASRGTRPAALLVDTVFSSDGVYTDPVGFLAPAVEAVRNAGGLFIADEVQAGFGRSGDMWGFQRHGVTPDIVTLGKPMGNGHPVAGIVARPELISAFGQATRYFNTFGGNPVSMAAASAVLDVIEQENLPAHAAQVGTHLRERLAALADKHRWIGDVRGAGLFVGVELVRDRAARQPAPEETLAVVNGMRERGVLVSSTGPHASVLKIRPPLVFTQAHADVLAGTLDEVLAALSAA